MQEWGSKGYMTTTILLADSSVCGCLLESGTLTLLSIDTRWEEVLSAVAGLYLELSESRQKHCSNFVSFSNVFNLSLQVPL